MSEIKQKALDVMNIEMSKQHSAAIDKIHNWLCEQESDELFENIQKPGKSIDSALQYVAKIAQKSAVGGSVCLTDEEVYDQVVKYYASEEKIAPVIAKVESGSSKKETFTEEQIEANKIRNAEFMEKLKAKQEAAKTDPVEPESNIMDIFEFGIEQVEVVQKRKLDKDTVLRNIQSMSDDDDSVDDLEVTEDEDDGEEND